MSDAKPTCTVRIAVEPVTTNGQTRAFHAPRNTKIAAAAAAIFVFLGAWNALVWPLVVTGSTAMRTVQVGLASLIYDQGYNLPVLMAAATLVALPVLLVYFAFQRLVVEAALQSGLKS